MKPTVTLVTPAYQAESFIEETLASVAAQTYENIIVLVSIDPSSDDTAGVCRRFAASDSRFRVDVHEQRSGWVGNANRTFDRVTTPYFMYMPHDDLLPQNYVEALVEVVDENPSAVCAFPDMERFENVSSRSHVESLIGTPAQRAHSWVSSGLGALPWKGVTRSTVLTKGLRLRQGPFDGFSSDSLWVTQLALMGECIRVPETVYLKRVRDGSVVRDWEAFPKDVLSDAMIDYVVATLNVLTEADLGPDEKAWVMEAVVGGLEELPHRWRPYGTDAERSRFLAKLIIEAQAGR